jgi:MoaA/NifB/PqqE/SkfB family radical SAM enzyme
MNRLISYPILCNYYITTRCNARCSFCDIYKTKGQNANFDEILLNLNDLKKLGIRFIDFTGGEPLLHPQLPEILKKAKNAGFLTTVTTNCILYPKLAQQISGLVDLLHFSLDAPVKAHHNEIRGVRCFQKVMESLEIAKKLGEKPDILFSVTDDNVGYLDQMANMAQKRKLILLVNPVFEYFNNPEPNSKTLDKVYAIASQPYVYVNRGILRLMRSNGNDIHNPRCRAVTTTVVISSDNNVLLPCYHKRKMKIHIQGNLYEIIKSKPVKQYRKMEGRFPFCNHCRVSCYFDPSFTYGADNYFWLSQISKTKYLWDKYIRRF